MKTHSRIGFSIRSVAAVIALGAVLLAASQAYAQSEAVSVGSATINPGASNSVDVQSINIASPGLGAWEIGITYDPSVVTALSCSESSGSVCNANFASNRVQVTGASAGGLTGDATLASITFECLTTGTSVLTVSLDVFADATIGGPQPIGPAIQNGLITCTDSGGLPDGGATPRPMPTSAPVVTTLPDSGTGTGGNATLNWTIAGLAFAGLATLATVSGIGALRLQRRRSSVERS